MRVEPRGAREMATFYGTANYSIDDKGRLVLPAAYRDEFAVGAVLSAKGDHVACYLYNSIEYLEVMLAAFKLRAVPINVPPRNPMSSLPQTILTRSNFKMRARNARYMSINRCAMAATNTLVFQ